MNLVIDLQGAQSPGSRSRGIGRYSISIAKALIETRGDHDVNLLLSAAFPESIQPLLEEFADLIPREKIHIWNPPTSIDYLSGRKKSRAIARILRENFIHGLAADALLITSFFEGINSDYCAHSLLDRGVISCITMHDIIPYLYADQCLRSEKDRNWYQERIDELPQFAMLFAISESAKNDCIQHLDLPEEKLCNASSAADPYFRKIEVDKKKLAKLKSKYRIQRELVMYTGGMDFRKNVDGLIKAYALLDKPYRKNNQLVIVGGLAPHLLKKMKSIAAEVGLRSNDVIFSGYVTDEELLYFYNIAKLFVFPSIYEGFGLPLLEAMNCGLPSIAANNSALPEVLGNEDALFDASSLPSIAQKITQLLANDALRADFGIRGFEHAKKFSMTRCALKHWDVIQTLKRKADRKQQQTAALRITSKKPLLALVSPMPPAESGIADYSAELIPEISRFYDIIIIESQAEVSAEVRNVYQVQTVAWFYENHKRFDRILYQIGNSDHHLHMIDMVNHFPGVVVLHDYFLSGLYHEADRKGLLGEDFYSVLSMLFQGSIAELDERNGGRQDSIRKYPMNEEILLNSRGIIVHSKYSQDLATKWYGENFSDDWEIIPLLKNVNDCVSRAEARSMLGISEEEFIVCSFGNVAPSKLNHRALDCWNASRLRGKARLIFVGDEGGAYREKLAESIPHDHLSNEVVFTGWAEKEVYDAYLAAADFAIQLRADSRGETSGTIVDCMKYQLPVISNRNGAMAELLPAGPYLLDDDFTDADLIAAMDRLFESRKERDDFGNLLYEKVKREADPEKCGRLYHDAIEKFYRKNPVFRSDVARELVSKTNDFETEISASELGKLVVENIPMPQSRRRIFVDLTSDLSRGYSEDETRALIDSLTQALGDPTCKHSLFLIAERSNGDAIYLSFGSGSTLAESDQMVHFLKTDHYVKWSPTAADFSHASALFDRLDQLGVAKHAMFAPDAGTLEASLVDGLKQRHFTVIDSEMSELTSRSLAEIQVTPAAAFLGKRVKAAARA